MSMTVQLPPALRERLDHLAVRIRLLRFLRGLSVLVLALVVTAGLALLVDYLFDSQLPALVRCLNFVVWLGLGGLLGWAGLASFRRSIDPADLAAVIEQRHPELGERLTTSVELCEHGSAGCGSPALIDLLVRETEARTHPLDFRSVISGRSTVLLSGLAAVLALAGLVPAITFPEETAHLARRFVLPWQTPAPLPDYRFAVTPGDTVAARGRVLAISADLTPRNSRIALPKTATLVVIATDGSETRSAMQPASNKPSEFSIKYRVPGDFEYRIEAGNAASDPSTITAVTPVELAEDSPTVTITPPAYARASVETETRNGLVDLSALQHSQLTFAFTFTRPPVKAWVEWTVGQDEKMAGTKTTLPLVPTGNGKSATLTLPAREAGAYRVILEAEHGIRTERDGGTLTIRPDLPPALLRYAGKETVLNVRPYDRVPIEVRLADDIGLAGAEVVYTINDEKTFHEEKIPLDGTDKREAVGRLQWMLAGKVKEGDRVRFRICFRDNLPKEFGGPHVVIYPEDRWLELAVVKGGKSFREAQILAERDDINRRLEDIKAELKQEKRIADRIRAESRDKESLTPDQDQTVRELRTQNQNIEKDLRELAQKADAAVELEKLADLARDVADKNMRATASALEDTTRRDAKASTREKRFRDADRELDEALKKLEGLRDLNERLARKRLDQAKVEALADRQNQLAEQAAELSGKHPVQDPEAKKRAEKLRQEQAEVAQELQRLTQDSDTLKKALEEARAEQARQSAQKAQDLAQAQRDLANASEQTERQREAGQLAELAKQQKSLAERAGKLSKETEQEAKQARTQPLKPEAAEKAAQELARGDSEKALPQQDRAAAELDRLANELDRARNRADDPREAARHLGAQQKELEDRSRREQQSKDPKPLAERLKPLKAEQEALKQAAQNLAVPEQYKSAEADRKRAETELAKAADELGKNRPAEARQAMRQARQALEQMANKLPSLTQRHQQAQRELERMQREQDSLARQAQEAARDSQDSERKLNELARRQAALADSLAKLDTPKKEARKEQAVEAHEKALEDLRSGRKQDVAASQEGAKREIERLRQALAGQKPDDERAAELARQQSALARKAEEAAANPKTPQQKLDELKREQRRLADQTQALQAREAPATKHQAAEATRSAADKANANPSSKESRQAMAEAAKKLQELAKATSGQESEAEKAARAARRQAEEAQRSRSTDAQQRQKEVAEEAKNVRAGKAAEAEKEKAGEALKRAEAARGAEQPKAQREAADALKELADKLAGQKQRNDPTQPANPQQQARQLAKQQADLARQSRQAQQNAAQRPGEASKKELQQAMQKASEAQRKLEDQAGKLPARGNQKAVEQARQAMEQARQAAKSNNAVEAAQKQHEAAQALQRLANKLPQRTSPSQPDARAKDDNPPSKQQAEQARQLAKEQRDLREAVRRSAEKAQSERRAETASRDNPAGQLAKQQADIASEAGKLAQAVGQEQGAKSAPAQQAQQASQSSRQAAKDLNSGALPQATQAGEQSAKDLRQLTRQLAQTPRGKTEPGQPDTLQQARNLMRRQEDLNRQLQPLAKSSQAQRAQQQARQGDLSRQTGELMRQLEQMGQTPGRSPQAQQSSNQAAQAARQAQQSMQQAEGQARQGNQSATQQARNQAAQSLENAARQATQAAQQSQQATQQQGQPPAAPTGQAVQQARQQMNQAQGQLQQGRPNSARASMQQAGQALENAARQMSQALRPSQQQGQPPAFGNPTAMGAAGGGTPTAKDVVGERFGFDGKKWGELPGELRTKIVQDMKAKYGEDYARMIKLYFEQIADTRKTPGAKPGGKP
jgi:hypothetical protein